ncbi:MAG: SDR family NAD(P)-dependent oxidoreductase [Rikenellaceae bacterium]
MEKNEYALITGASMGLGRSFALELASRGYNLLLVSLPNEKLDEVAQECRSKGVECTTYEFDLTNRERRMEFVDEVNSSFEISILINNVGIGGSREFVSTKVEYIETMLSLNIVVMTTLVHQFLPNLMRQKRGYILNISSMISLVPTGFKTTYPSSKAYIRHFSSGLREELRGSNTSVTTVILGPMPTKEDVIRRIEAQGFMGRIITLSTEEVARKSIDSLFSRRGERIIGKYNQLLSMLLAVIPMKVKTFYMTRTVKKNEINESIGDRR